MKLFQQVCFLIITATLLNSAFSAEGDNPPPKTKFPLITCSSDDAQIPLAYFFIKINPATGLAPNEYMVSLDLSKIYGQAAANAYQLNVGDRLTVKVDFDAYPDSNFMEVASYHHYAPVFVNRELPKQGGSSWRIQWSEKHSGTWGIFGHLENQGWSDWWYRKTLLRIVDRSEQTPAYVTYEAVDAGEVSCYYSHQLDVNHTSYVSCAQR